MKILIISDLHHGTNSSESFINYQKKGLEYVKEIIKKRDVDLVVNCGDTYDKRLAGDFMIIDTFKKIHKEISQMCEYIVIAGNHDCYYTNTNKITSLPVMFEGGKLIIDDVYVKDNLIFCPWINELNAPRISKQISKHNNEKNYLFGHFDFSGFRHGQAISKKDSLFKTDYWKYKKIISGHYHMSQQKDNIFYCGSLYQKNRGELEKKYCHLLNTETNKIESFEMKERYYEKIIINDEKDFLLLKKCHNTISDVFINSSNEEFWVKVETKLGEYSPVKLTLTYKNDIINQCEELVDTDILTNEELNHEFLCKLDHDDDDFKKEFEEMFKKYWEKSYEN